MSRADPPVGGQTQTDARAPGHLAGPSDGEDWTRVLRPPVRPGELGRLGPYRVLGVLGRGGMGVVFLADDPRLDRRIALKTLLPGAGRGAARRFLHEARAQAAVEHDHIVPVHQVGEDGGVPYLAMPMLRGDSLATVLAGGKLSPAEVVRIGAEVADGLAAAHARGLIHRDIKPGNVWLEGDRRRVKILDFGLVLATGQPEALAPVAAIGTPDYMSPEQARGRSVDARTDLFSLGALLYQAATGVKPFAGPGPVAVLVAVLTSHPAPPVVVDPAVPAELSRLILRLLAKEAESRPATAEAVAAELRAMIPTAPPVGRWRAGLGALVAVLAGGSAAYMNLPASPPYSTSGNRLTGLVTETGGTVRLTDGTTVCGADRPPRPTAVTIRAVAPAAWRELVAALADADTLTQVEFVGSPLTDADLALLAASPLGRRLEGLAVTDCPGVTGPGLSVLARMTELRQLRLGVPAPADVVRELATRLPRCRIQWPGGVIEPTAD